MLELHDISVDYGSVHAVRNVYLHIEPGEVVLIRGHFGVGKSSLLNAILGVVKSSGRIRIAQHDYDRRTPYKMAKAGIAIMPEGQAIFRHLTTRQNLQLGAIHADQKIDLLDVLELFPDLERHLETPAYVLSGGQSQMLSFARAIMTSPKYLLLDEPSLGLAKEPIEKIAHAIAKQAAAGTGVLMVEQHANELEAVAGRMLIMDQGWLSEGRIS